MTTHVHADGGRTAEPEPRPAVSAELLDVRDLAVLLGGCSTRHVYRLVDAGLMPRGLKLGTLLRWRKSEILEWIDAGCPPTRQSKAPGR